MKVLQHSLLLLLLVALQACNQNDAYNQKTKALDSLNGALNLKVRELEKTDTALLQRCITRYNYYRQFIKQNVNDTLTKSEADNLQRFLSSGKNLENFWSNRFSILGRASLINSQQTKLATDVKNHAVDIMELEQFLMREKLATSEILEAATAQQKVYYSSLEEFRIALQEVENIIRLRNKGQLPTIVKDTVAL